MGCKYLPSLIRTVPANIRPQIKEPTNLPGLRRQFFISFLDWFSILGVMRDKALLMLLVNRHALIWRQYINPTTRIAKRTLLAGSSIQTRCVEYYYIRSRRDIIGEAGATSFKCMVRYARTGPALSTQHGLDIGWSATCDREFTIVVHINIVMSYGSSYMHEMLNTKQTWCCLHEYFISNRSFNEYASTCSTHSARSDYSS